MKKIISLAFKNITLWIALALVLLIFIHVGVELVKSFPEFISGQWGGDFMADFIGHVLLLVLGIIVAVREAIFATRAYSETGDSQRSLRNFRRTSYLMAALLILPVFFHVVLSFSQSYSEFSSGKIK